MHAVLFRDPTAPPSNDWRWRLESGSRIVASGQPHDSPSKAQRAVEGIIRSVASSSLPVLAKHTTASDGSPQFACSTRFSM